MASEHTPTIIVNSDTTTIVAKGSIYSLVVLFGGLATMLATFPVNHSEKPYMFGLNFKRWQHKILFYLITWNLVKFLIMEASKLPEGELDAQYLHAQEA